MSKVGHILTQNLNYRGHLWSFEAENTPQSGSFKVENNAQTLPSTTPKQLLKSPENDFFDP